MLTDCDLYNLYLIARLLQCVVILSHPSTCGCHDLHARTIPALSIEDDRMLLQDQTSQILLARAASRELSRAGSFELLSALLSPMGSLDSALDKYDQTKHGALQTPEQRLLQQTLLAELLGSMKRTSFAGGK
jgi:hypothetical protein